MARKPKSTIEEGDEVLIRGRVTLIHEDRLGPVFVVEVHGALIATKVQLREEAIEVEAPEK